MGVDDFHVVGIGASAGGLEAILNFFSYTPTEPNVAFIIVRHLKRDFQSTQENLIKAKTSLEVKTIENGERIRKNVIYLLPENKKLLVKDRILELQERPNDEIINSAIDDFFESFSKDIKDKAIGIILSGTGTDGTKGAYAIEESGGIVMVQEPTQAHFDGMPKNVIYFDHPDYVLHLEEMNNYIQAHIQNPKKARLLFERESK